jgi:hypothetical protein
VPFGPQLVMKDFVEPQIGKIYIETYGREEATVS